MLGAATRKIKEIFKQNENKNEEIYTIKA